MNSFPARALVTGASGFIGRRLVAALVAEGFEVVAFVRDADQARRAGLSEVIYRSGDVTDADSVRGIGEGATVVFHLASQAEGTGQARAGGEAHRRVTVGGTSVLLMEAARAGVERFIFVSSVKAMGEGAPGCLDETAPCKPVSAYGRAKHEAEQLVVERGRLSGMQTCVVRLPMVYGPNPNGNVIRMIAAIDRGRFPPLPDTGNRRSLVHVDDVVLALRLVNAYPAASGQVYLVTDGRVYSTRDIYVALCNALGKPVPRWTVPLFVLTAGARVGDFIERGLRATAPLNSDTVQKLLGSAWYSSGKLQRELGFKPTYTLEQALPEMVELYRAAARDRR